MMKKILFLLLSVGLISSCCTQEQVTQADNSQPVYKTKKAEKFVNPIFYKTMYPDFRKDVWDWTIQITPTKMLEENSDGWVQKSYCDMLENKEDEVTLKCTTIHPPSHSLYTLVYRFIIKDQSYPKQTYIKRLYFSVNEYSKDKDDYSGVEHFHTEN